MNSFAGLRVLSDAEIEKIQQATEDLLATCGFEVQHEILLRKAREAGADVDTHAGIVRIPPELLRELIDRIPRYYSVRGVTGETWEVGGDSQHALAIVTDPWIVDYETGRPRRPCLDDIRRHTILAQCLEPICAVSLMDFPVTDFDDATSALRAMEVYLTHSTRHNYVLPASVEKFQRWAELLGLLCGNGNPAGLSTVGIAVESPLVLNATNAEILVRAAQQGCRIVPTVCPMAGTTAPYSLAGTLLQSNVEVLAVALMAQLVKPGTPFLYTSGLSVADMRTGQDLYYSFDKVLWKIGGAQLGLAYGVPTAAECGGTLTYRYDQQSGAEGMLFMLAAHASGAHMLAGFGSCHNANGMSAEMMVIHEAYLKAAQFLARGIDTDDLHLAVGNIRSAGPGGHFLTDELTLKLLRAGEFWNHEVFDMSGGYGDSPSLLDRAHARADALIASHESRVPGSVREKLQRYFHDLYARMGSTG